MTHEEKLAKANQFMEGVHALEAELGVTLKVVATVTNVGAYLQIEDESIQLESLHCEAPSVELGQA